MAHFAKLDENNIVLEVNVVSNNELDSLNEETSGITFLTEWSGGHSNWKRTSYNGNIRKNYAAIGFTYDATRDAFIAPKPFNSWVLDENTCRWQAPTPMPTTEGKFYYWSEDDLSWRERQ
jgi:hypothetical protein